VGVLAGDFSQHILDATEPKELHLIDVFNCDDYPAQKRFVARENEAFVKHRYQKQIAEGKVTVKTGLSWEMLATYEDEYFDWIYIDAAHDYKSVVKDLAEAGKKIKPEGILVLNDYILFDHRSKSDYGVVQATNEFMLEHRFEMIYFAFHPELFCDVAIKRIKE